MATVSNALSEQVLTGLSHLNGKYKGLILDQFGVLHNGKEALPGAVDCVKKLYNDGVKMIILSNSPQNEEHTLDRLVRLGFDREHFIGSVTSGTLSTPQLNAGKFGSSCLFFSFMPSDPRGERFIRQAGVKLASGVQDAHFLLAHCTQAVWSRDEAGEEIITPMEGLYETGKFPSEVDQLFRVAISNNLLMVCINPDKVTVMPSGDLKYMSGLLAERYENLGGRVKYFGKPFPDGFQACIERLGLPSSSVAHVGDSLEHDVKGANEVGVASVFVTAGIHYQELECNLDTSSSSLLEKEDLLRRCFVKFGQEPSHIIPAFKY